MSRERAAESPPGVTVVVLNWNGWHYLGPCLASLKRQTYPNFEVIVVDNGSTDGSPEILAEQFPAVRLIRNEKNLGFAAANNQAIRASSSPYVATLNNDTVAEPTWLAALVAAAEGNERWGAVGSKMVLARNPQVIDSCGIALDRAGIAWDLLGGRPAATVDRPREVFGACAGAALYRRSMLDEIGLFDEDFFAYLEDADLAWRARLAGWRAVLAPNAVVHHVHSGSLGDASPRKRFLLGRNKIWMIAKCLPTRDVWQLPLILAYDLGAVGMRLLARDWASLAGRLVAWTHLPLVLAKRRGVHGRRLEGRPAAAFFDRLVSPGQSSGRFRHLAAPRSARDGRPWVARAASGRTLARSAVLRVAAAVLNTLAGARPRSRHDDPRPTRIVVLRADHLGDVLLSRPAIELLRQSCPEAEITVVAGPWAAPALQGLDCRVVAFPFPGFERAPQRNPAAPYVAAAGFAAHLAREDFDAAVVLRPDHWWGALVCSLARIPIRVGHALPLQARFLTHALPVQTGEAAAESALRAARLLVGALGIETTSAAGKVSFAPSEGARHWAQEWMASNVDGRPRIALHPGAGAEVKLWPAHRWAAVADELMSDGAALILTGGAPDRALVADIQRLAARPLAPLLGASWDQLGALYEEVDLVLGVDSGPLHLAAAVGTPTTRLFGPSDPSIYGPAGEPAQHRVLQGGLRCAPCGNLQAPLCGYVSSPPCLGAIGVDVVLDTVRTQLGADAPARGGNRAPRHR